MDWVLVAEADGRVVGYASYILDGRRGLAEVGNNAVDPAYQGRGIGKLMQQEVFARFEEEGYSMRTVSTLVEDLPARKIYERMCFEEITRSIVYLKA
jgi:ribosomal protein S18 acetylase RimI-like enzyme